MGNGPFTPLAFQFHPVSPLRHSFASMRIEEMEPLDVLFGSIMSQFAAEESLPADVNLESHPLA